MSNNSNMVIKLPIPRDITNSLMAWIIILLLGLVVQVRTCSGVSCPACVFGLCAGPCRQRWVNHFGVCHSCSTNCLECSTPPSGLQCKRCEDSFGVSNNVCVPCTDENPNCLLCSQDVQKCSSCDLGYGLDNQGSTIICSLCESLCQQCASNYQVCTDCQPGQLLDSLGKCGLCSYKCLDCNTSIVICQQCDIGYGVSAAKNCQLCEDFCLQCSTNQSFCTLCIDDDLHGLKNGVCANCHSTCKTCDRLNYSKCKSCYNQTYLNNGACPACSNHCLFCVIGTFCNECQDGFVQVGGYCQQCPPYCSLCHKNPDLSIQCTQCIPGDYELNDHIPPTCRQFCGDGITTDHPCDNQLGIALDGCDDECQIMDGFVCQLQSDTSSICSYQDTLQLTYDSFSRDKFDNVFTLTVLVFPPLYSLSFANRLKSMFAFNNPGVEIQSVVLNNERNKLTFIASFSSNLAKQDLSLSFKQPLVNNQKTIFQIDYGIHQPYYYSHFILILSRWIFPYCILLTILSWISVILGIILRKMAGLQAMFVLQLSWLNFLWIDSYLTLPLAQTFPLKFTTGYSLKLFTDNYPITLSSPYNFQFQLSSQLLANNFNVSFILIFLPLLFSAISFIRLCLFQNNVYKNSLLNNEKNLKQLQRIDDQYSICTQLLMNGCALNFVYLVHCIIAFFAFGGQISHVPSLVFSTVSIVTILGIFLKFFLDPYRFGYFREQFENQILSGYHFFVHLFIILSIVIFQTILSKHSYVPLIPSAAMVIYTLVFRPYTKFYENLRSAFNYLLISSFIVLKVLVHFLEGQIQIGNLSLYIFFIENLGLLLFCLIMANVFMLVSYFEQKKLSPIIEAVDNIDSFVSRQRNMKVLRDLCKTQMNHKMKKQSLNTIFTKVVDGNISMKKSSNFLWDQFKMNNLEQVSTFESEGLKLMKATMRDHNFYNAQLCQNKNPKLSNIRNELKIDYIKSEKIIKNFNEAKLQYDKPIIVNDETSSDSYYHNVLFEGEVKVEQYKDIARVVLCEENRFINVKGIISAQQKHLSKLTQHVRSQLLQIYQQI